MFMHFLYSYTNIGIIMCSSYWRLSLILVAYYCAVSPDLSVAFSANDEVLTKYYSNDRVTFLSLDVVERLADKSGNELLCLDTRPRGLFVVARNDSLTIRQQYDLAIKTTPDRSPGATVTTIPADIEFRLVGRFSGDGRGDTKSYFTERIELKEFVSYENNIVILANSKFEGPSTDGIPKGRVHYLSVNMPPMPPGRYLAVVRVSPEPTADQQKFGKTRKFPEFGILSCAFEVKEGK